MGERGELGGLGRVYIGVRAVDGKRLEIEGRVYDLEDPEQRKAAVRAWLRSKSRGRGSATEREGETVEDRPISGSVGEGRDRTP